MARLVYDAIYRSYVTPTRTRLRSLAFVRPNPTDPLNVARYTLAGSQNFAGEVGHRVKVTGVFDGGCATCGL